MVHMAPTRFIAYLSLKKLLLRVLLLPLTNCPTISLQIQKRLAPQSQTSFHLQPHEWFLGLQVQRLPHLQRVVIVHAAPSRLSANLTPRKLLAHHPVPPMRLIALIVLVLPPILQIILPLNFYLLQQCLIQVRLVKAPQTPQSCLRSPSSWA